MSEPLYRRAKMHAAEHGKSIADVIELSVSAYLAAHEGGADERLAAFERFTSSPFVLTAEQLDSILEEDALEQ